MNLDKKLLSILIPELVEMEYPDLYPTKYLYVYEPEMELTLSYLFLMWPDFKIIDDIVCIISGENYRLFNQNELKRKIDKLRSESKSNKEIEKELNTIHFLTWFNNDISPITNERMDVFCTMILEIWQMKLKLDFPGNDFVFELDKETWISTFFKKEEKIKEQSNKSIEYSGRKNKLNDHKKKVEKIFIEEIFHAVKDPGEYAIQQGSLSYGIAYMFFYWPNLIEYKGYIVIEHILGILASDDYAYQFLNNIGIRNNCSLKDIFYKYNTFELYDLPIHSSKYPLLNANEIYRFIFQTMEVIYIGKIKSEFPELRLRLSIPCSDEDIEGAHLHLLQEKG